jgi:hypothetical protein
VRKLTIAVVLFALAMPAFAHKEDYIGETLVFMTLTRRALEPEFWIAAIRGE